MDTIRIYTASKHVRLKSVVWSYMVDAMFTSEHGRKLSSANVVYHNHNHQSQPSNRGYLLARPRQIPRMMLSRVRHRNGISDDWDLNNSQIVWTLVMTGRKPKAPFPN
jgi:hypothetical protein